LVVKHLATDQSRQTDAGHEHGWLTESGHQTSEGRIVYVRCAHCGARRVDLEQQPLLPPRALSAEVPGHSS
jgi:hypothetical protein